MKRERKVVLRKLRGWQSGSVVESLLSKYTPLSSSPSTTKKRGVAGGGKKI
jgi:hypothetical protein